MYASVALPLPFKFHSGGYDGLTYSIPDELRERAQVGVRVLVPLGKRYVTGVLAGLHEKPQEKKFTVRPIADVLDAAPVFDEVFLQWTKWIASYYLCSWGEVLEAALPEGLRPETKLRLYPVGTPTHDELTKLQKSAPKRAALLKLISEYQSGVYISHLEKKHKLKGIYHQVFSLEADGYIRTEQPLKSSPKVKTQRVVLLGEQLQHDTSVLNSALIELERAPKQARVLLRLMQQHQLHPDEALPQKLLETEVGVTTAVVKALYERNFIQFDEREITPDIRSEVNTEHDITNISLSDEQRAAIDTILSSLSQKQPQTYLLHGITGSGKTEVYIALAKHVLESGGGVLVLVPEISLTPQLIERFEKRLSAGRSIHIAVQHSKMSQAERYRSWKMLSSGESRICIGARSAVFAPVQNVQLVIVDEEHEVTFKQYDSLPRYNARDAAVMRAHLSGGVAVLGSATPSLESYFNASNGKYQMLKLTKRAQEAVLPEVTITDMRTRPMRKEQAAKLSAFSNELLDTIRERIERKEGVVLLQNRRGFATYIGCSKCGASVMCPNCSVTLTFHSLGGRMHCHYCGFTQYKPKACPTCGSEKVFEGGIGTQRVEEELHEHVPDARTLRMDLDTTARKGAYETILRTFAEGKADILLGTQMVAKGLDFPRVTLVGVINADTSLSIPDFRSGERTFQLLTQVSGRAGRKELRGEVIIQTMQPDHPAIQFVREHNYEAFYAYELPHRRELLYPPYSRLVLIEFKGMNEEAVRAKAFGFAQLFPASDSYYRRLGPAEAVLKKIRGEYRWHITLLGYRQNDPNGERLRRLLSGALEMYHTRLASQAVRVTVDVDAQGIL